MVRNGSKAMLNKCLTNLNCKKAVDGRLANNEERRERKRQREAGMINDEPKPRHQMTLRSATKNSQNSRRQLVISSSSSSSASSRESVRTDHRLSNRVPPRRQQQRRVARSASAAVPTSSQESDSIAEMDIDDMRDDQGDELAQDGIVDLEQEEDGARVDDPTSNGLSVQRLVQQLKQMLTFLKIDFFDLRTVIDALLTCDDEIIPFNEITPVLEYFLIGLTRKFKSAASSQIVPKREKRSVKEVMNLFKYLLIGLNTPSLLAVEARLEQFIDNMESDIEIVLNDHIKQCIRNVLFAISKV